MAVENAAFDAMGILTPGQHIIGIGEIREDIPT